MLELKKDGFYYGYANGKLVCKSRDKQLVIGAVCAELENN